MFGKIFGKKEIECNADLIKALKKLNRGVTITEDEDGLDHYVMVSCAPEALRLPKPFYYNKKNGITNKHQTASGHYTCLDVIQC